MTALAAIGPLSHAHSTHYSFVTASHKFVTFHPFSTEDTCPHIRRRTKVWTAIFKVLHYPINFSSLAADHPLPSMAICMLSLFTIMTVQNRFVCQGNASSHLQTDSYTIEANSRYRLLGQRSLARPQRENTLFSLEWKRTTWVDLGGECETQEHEPAGRPLQNAIVKNAACSRAIIQAKPCLIPGHTS